MVEKTQNPKVKRPNTIFLKTALTFVREIILMRWKLFIIYKINYLWMRSYIIVL